MSAKLRVLQRAPNRSADNSGSGRNKVPVEVLNHPEIDIPFNLDVSRTVLIPQRNRARPAQVCLGPDQMSAANVQHLAVVIEQDRALILYLQLSLLLAGER